MAMARALSLVRAKDARMGLSTEPARHRSQRDGKRDFDSRIWTEHGEGVGDSSWALRLALFHSEPAALQRTSHSGLRVHSREQGNTFSYRGGAIAECRRPTAGAFDDRR